MILKMQAAFDKKNDELVKLKVKAYEVHNVFLKDLNEVLDNDPVAVSDTSAQEFLFSCPRLLALLSRPIERAFTFLLSRL